MFLSLQPLAGGIRHRHDVTWTQNELTASLTSEKNSISCVSCAKNLFNITGIRRASAEKKGSKPSHPTWSKRSCSCCHFSCRLRSSSGSHAQNLNCLEDKNIIRIEPWPQGLARERDTGSLRAGTCRDTQEQKPSHMFIYLCWQQPLFNLSPSLVYFQEADRVL